MSIAAGFPDVVGMVGVSLVLIAYTLLNLSKIKSTHMAYLSMNLIGSIFLLFSLLFHWNLSSVVIEIAWITISVIGIWRVLKAKRLEIQDTLKNSIDDEIALSYK